MESDSFPTFDLQDIVSEKTEFDIEPFDAAESVELRYGASNKVGTADGTSFVLPRTETPKQSSVK